LGPGTNRKYQSSAETSPTQHLSEQIKTTNKVKNENYNGTKALGAA